MNRLTPGNNTAMTATESFTGRKKVTLTPGHSLMDWIKLGRTEGDLSGVGSTKKPVTLADLALHNTQKDIWMAVRGKVYNLTRYMDFHPGGIDELMRAAGKDGTELFDEIHNWVNVESMLEKCYVGPLRLGGRSKQNDSLFLVPPPKPMQSREESVASEIVQLPSTYPTPTHDFYQSGDWVTIVVYTQNENLTCQDVLVDTSNNQILIQVVLHLNSFFVHVKPVNPILDMWTCDNIDAVPNADAAQKTGDDTPASMDNNHAVIVNESASPANPSSVEFSTAGDSAGDSAVVNKDHLISVVKGKVEVKLKKKSPEHNWESLGLPLEYHMVYPRTRSLEGRFHQWMCVSNREVTHDTRLLEFRCPPTSHMITPIGYHIHVKRSIAGMVIARSYTVVAPSLLESPQNALAESGKYLFLMVKTYKGGVVSPWLCATKPGDRIPISTYDGSFDLGRLNNTTSLVMFAAGTGFTSMVRVIKYALSNPSFNFPVRLVFFNKFQKDILWQDQLESLAQTEKRFTVTNVLSQETEANWKGLKGRVNNQHIENFVPRPSKSSRPLLLICGPWAYNDSVESLAKIHGLEDEHIHIFSTK